MATLAQGTGSSAASSSSALNLSFVNPTVTGNLILVMGVTNGSGSPTMSVTDNMGNGTFTALTSANDASNTTRIQIHFKKNATGGSGHQITLTPSAAAFRSLAIGEFSSEATTGIQDGQATGGPTTGTNAATGTVTVLGGTGPDTLFAGMTHNGSTTTLTEGSGFSQVAEVETATNMPFNCEYKLNVTANQTCTWTNASVPWLAVGASFLEAAAAAQVLQDLMHAPGFVPVLSM